MIPNSKELYRKLVVPANKSRDGETPTLITVTEEVSGAFIWYSDVDRTLLLGFELYKPHRAIERAVDLGRMEPRKLLTLALDTGMAS